jgi:diguanylate cyclase (GGDEF)-like protein
MTASLGEIRRRNREMAVLAELGELLQTVGQTDEALPLVNRFMPLLFPQWSGALYLLDNSKVMLEPAVVWGGEAPDLSVFHPDECWGLRRGRPHVVEDPAAGLCCPHIGASCRDRRPYLCVPLTAHGEAIGLIHLHLDLAIPEGQQAGSIPEDLQRLAGTVADQLALSLSNLKLRENLHRQSIRDQLTGLFNRRYLDETLVREVSRAKRTNAPLGVIMLDIDHFKQFNDSFGHEAGDLVLRHLGEFLQTQVRREDMACRYGGEEFTLILPGASLSATRERAEALRQGMQRLRLRYGDQDLGTVTISLGVAVYPDHGVSPETVLQAADAALYAAKHAGRNRVMAADEAV